jgi:hypothetical protein
MSDYTLAEQVALVAKAMRESNELFHAQAHQRLLEHQAWMDAWLARFEAMISDNLSLEQPGQILYAEPDPRDPPRSPPPPMEGPAPVTASLAAMESDPRKVTEALLRPGLERRAAAVDAHRAAGGGLLGGDPGVGSRACGIPD